MTTVGLQDARGQLLAGLEALVRPALDTSGLVVPDAVIAGWPGVDHQQALRTGVLNPLVAIWLDTTKPYKQQPGTTSARTVQDPLQSPPQAQRVTLYETIRLQTPVWFVVFAGGDNGLSLAAQVASVIAGALVQLTGSQGALSPGQVAVVPLPDSMDTATVTDPALTTFGLTARLVYASEGQVVTGQQSIRDVTRYDLKYTAYHSRYVAQVDTTITGTNVTEEVGTGVLVTLPEPTPLP